VGTALVVLGKFIRTSVRKVTGGTDRNEACRREQLEACRPTILGRC